MGLDSQIVGQALTALDGAGPHLADNKSFQELQARFTGPSSQFLYCDEKQLFERTYNLASAVALLAGKFAPKFSQDVDLTRLPQTAVIARHLGPAIMVTQFDGKGLHQAAYGPVNLTLMTALEAAAIAVQLSKPPAAAK